MEFITKWGMIAGLAGIALGIFVVLFREIIIKNIFSKLTKRQSYSIIIVFMLLVWSLSVFSIIQYYNSKSIDPYQITVFVHGEKGKDDIVLPNRGKVKLIYGDATVEKIINNEGEVTFKQIPPEYFRSGATVELLFFDPMGEPYGAINPDSLYRVVKGKPIYLVVKLYGLNKFSGIVKDSNTGYPIQGVRISIPCYDTNSIVTYSNKFGEFILLIPPSHQRKFQTVRAFKEGYRPFELKDIPILSEKEFIIIVDSNNKRK